MLVGIRKSTGFKNLPNNNKCPFQVESSPKKDPTTITAKEESGCREDTLDPDPKRMQQETNLFSSLVSKWIKKHVGVHTHADNDDEFAYRKSFSQLQFLKNMEVITPASPHGCNLLLRFHNAMSIVLIEFKVDKTAKEAIAKIEKYIAEYCFDEERNKFISVIICVGSNYHYDSAQGRLTCDWITRVYQYLGNKNIVLKTDLPREFTISMAIRKVAVHDHYDNFEEIGSGTNNTVVYKCREKRTGIIFAAKVIPLSGGINDSLRERNDVIKEINIMCQLYHSNLVTLHEAFEYDKRITLIIDYLFGGTLSDKVGRISEAKAIDYTRQICEGLQYMHKLGIYHTNLKLENIMLCRSYMCVQIKIIDFAFAYQVDSNIDELDNSFENSSDDLNLDEQDCFDLNYGFYNDMRGVGSIVYNLLCGKLKCATDTDIKDLNLNFENTYCANLSKECRDFMKQLLFENINELMTASEALDHPWLTRRPVD